MKVMNHGGVRLALSSNPPFKYDAQVNADETDTPAWVLFLFEGQPVRLCRLVNPDTYVEITTDFPEGTHAL